MVIKGRIITTGKKKKKKECFSFWMGMNGISTVQLHFSGAAWTLISPSPALLSRWEKGKGFSCPCIYPLKTNFLIGLTPSKNSPEIIFFLCPSALVSLPFFSSWIWNQFNSGTKILFCSFVLFWEMEWKLLFYRQINSFSNHTSYYNRQ